MTGGVVYELHWLDTALQKSSASKESGEQLVDLLTLEPHSPEHKLELIS